MNDTMITFIPNDQMWLDGDEAWFVDMFENILFTWNLTTEKCRYIAKIPGKVVFKRHSSEKNYFVNPRCVKYKNLVFCMPFFGGNIFVYDTISNKFTEIDVDNSNKEAIRIHDFWVYDGKIWIVANGVNLIIEIDLEKKSVNEYYSVFENTEYKMNDETIKVGEYIYGASKNSNMIFEFNIITKKIQYYKVQGMERGITTICCSEGLFWLGGYNKCIYIWNKEKNEIEHILEMPKDFINEDCFCKSVCVGKYIWLLPSHVQPEEYNKVIYIDKDNYWIRTFDFGNAKRLDLWENKYVLEYIRKNRYIGIRYTGNRYVTEIDIENFQNSIKYMKIDRESYTTYWRNKMSKGLLVEKFNNDIRFFIESLV